MDIHGYSSNGAIHLTGDLNARVAIFSDVVEHINLERFVDISTVYDTPVLSM